MWGQVLSSIIMICKLIIVSLTAVLTLANSSRAQTGMGEIILPLDSLTNKYAYRGVVQDTLLTSAQLYYRIRKWLTEEHMDDIWQINITNEKLVDRGSFIIEYIPPKLKNPVQQEVSYLIILDFKDGRFRYQITDFFVGDIGNDDHQYTLEQWTSLSDKWTLPEVVMISRRTRKLTSEMVELSIPQIHFKILQIVDSLKNSVKPSVHEYNW